MEFWYHLPVTQSIDYVLKAAKKAAELGFDVISHQDHFLVVDEERGCRPELWTMLTAVALTTGVKVSPLVSCMLFRNPALVAKIVATLDQLTKGRVYMGVGACWWKEEFEAYGYEWVPPKVRVDMTIEAVKIIKKLWTEEKVDYDGKFWKIKNCKLVPRPYQKPHPPIISGGYGPRMLRMTAKYCNGWIPEIRDPEKYKKYMDYMEKWMKNPENFLYGTVISIWEGKTDYDSIIKTIDSLSKIGVKAFVFFIHPQAKNLELL
ncbi:MAG TPA: LLM class flavin-dependent oxidoreductase, partial [Thermoproteales archaeon]|nr:LLM class flavin-dependent oxidoreductase [Thermoproteales archaeon]